VTPVLHPNDAPDTNDPEWVVYIIECSDGSLYTGISNDMVRRLEQHNAGMASRYTRSRRPVCLRYREPCDNRSDALLRECALKLLSRKEKQALIQQSGNGS
jgi:predicted GIY-YIG superfamily endonuclease